jgi:hypothetical protein
VFCRPLTWRLVIDNGHGHEHEQDYEHDVIIPD